MSLGDVLVYMVMVPAPMQQAHVLKGGKIMELFIHLQVAKQCRDAQSGLSDTRTQTTSNVCATIGIHHLL